MTIPYCIVVGVIEDLQRRVVREFGYEEDEEEAFGLSLLRCAESLVRDNPLQLDIVKEISLYRKYNRAREGEFQQGQDCPLLPRPLHYDDEVLTPVPFEELVKQSWSRPLVLVSGSYS